MKAPQNNTINPTSASANGLQRSRVIVVFDVRSGMKSSVSVGILAIAIVAGLAAWYWTQRDHSLTHAALSGNDQPIRAALDREPGNPELWALLGEAYAHQARYPEAVEAYDRSIAKAPNSEETWWMKGIAEVCRGNKAGVALVAARLQELSKESAAEFRRLAPSGCCAFGSGCRE